MKNKTIASLIDCQNVSHEAVEPVLNELAKYGVVNIRRMYGDWKRNQLKNWAERSLSFVLKPVQQFGYTKGKNATDAAMPASPPRLLLAALACVLAGGSLAAGPLEAYVHKPDDSFAWQSQGLQKMDGLDVTTLRLTSQTWRGGRWTHTLYIARPRELRHPETAYLEIRSSASKKMLPSVKHLAESGGTWVAVLTDVPNQPLFGNKHEDALIAYTFDQYTKTGDETWPLLLPMTKSAVRAMDAVQAWALAEHKQKVGRFVVSGASKRGWTTWLTGAADPRVCAIVPAVIDMLNMRAQTQWAQRVYGSQSEMIRDYTDIGLVEKLDSPEARRLIDIVDPYSYRAAFTMPKLLLLGTNDPFWTVDALRHYWDALPGPKLVYQSPNAGHGASGTPGAMQARAAFLRMVAKGRLPPQLTWRLENTVPAALHVTADRRAEQALLWTAHAPTRDFRKAVWKSRPLALDADGTHAAAEMPPPADGFSAFMAELAFTDAGTDFNLSTQVYVTPDD
jgi:PhoPQ-activated pathogenicity-related protein